ncbi:hypothetical protein AJ80_07058 [Polytolypa hystricis UAMH7299]|uniref:Uncharacterized protein n=1 Tax=Polytolypa hystricis (strain UAMH7299) TaxID=1447883 RepID=A0A2B7XSL2_POLH7|nr:hypothetical protein AJ80_07058 [Polytolypa hystricis UAMH7299]
MPDLNGTKDPIDGMGAVLFVGEEDCGFFGSSSKDPVNFWETYSLVRQNMFPKVHRTWLGLLNMVLVMATITAVLSFVPARTRISKSDVYYQRALGLSGKEILRGTTLEIGKG